MEAQPSLIMIQFLQWVADRPRSREDVMEAWRSSCPRFPVWEDARAEGLIRQCGGEARRTPGRADRARPDGARRARRPASRAHAQPAVSGSGP